MLIAFARVEYVYRTALRLREWPVEGLSADIGKGEGGDREAVRWPSRGVRGRNGSECGGDFRQPTLTVPYEPTTLDMIRAYQHLTNRAKLADAWRGLAGTDGSAGMSLLISCRCSAEKCDMSIYRECKSADNKVTIGEIGHSVRPVLRDYSQ